ncbi:MAG: hypothetical protein KQH53_00585 [Desulfarculaceae bacterium]|nr:hypothetical protein [Desulfarculaceae bacterium]
MSAPEQNPKSPSSHPMRELLVILLIAGVVFWVSSRLDVFEWLVDTVHHYEDYELDEVVVLLAILSLAFGAFAVRRWRESSREYARRLEAERLKVVLETAGTVSHEFNQPLQVIMGAAEMALLDVPEDSKLHKYLSNILDSAKKLAQLITKLNRITAYRRKPYYKDQHILDLD